jgi:RecA/RadA recombinase
MTDFSDLLKTAGNEYASIAEDGIESGDITGFIGTGSHSLNALLSGSIYGGLAANKVTALAGEPATGKTFFALNFCRQFLKENPNGYVFYFESESAISKEMLVERDIDTKRFGLIPVATVQEFRTQCIKILDKYIEMKNQKNSTIGPMMMVLDSLGNLSTEKEIADITEGKDTRDMTRAQLVRGAFRVLTLKLGKAQVPLIVTNHVYDQVGAYIPTKKMGGGSGLEYAASTIIFLTKKIDKVDKIATGAIITATLHKSRIAIEKQRVQTLLNYRTGLDPYYGLLDIGERLGVIKKVSTKYQFPDGSTAFESHIESKPEKYFTPEVLKAIEEKCKSEFLYGKSELIESEEIDDAE